MNDELKLIAKVARKAIERFAKDHDDIGRIRDLECYCAIGSYFLCMVARKFGYHLTLIEGVAYDQSSPNDTNHCWVQYQGKVIDITATQFGYTSKVRIVNIANKDYTVVRANNNARQSLRAGWDDQSPYNYLPYLRKLAKDCAMKIAA